MALIPAVVAWMKAERSDADVPTRAGSPVWTTPSLCAARRCPTKVNLTMMHIQSSQLSMRDFETLSGSLAGR